VIHLSNIALANSHRYVPRLLFLIIFIATLWTILSQATSTSGIRFSVV
jgi:hypothetical protein